MYTFLECSHGPCFIHDTFMVKGDMDDIAEDNINTTTNKNKGTESPSPDLLFPVQAREPKFGNAIGGPPGKSDEVSKSCVFCGRKGTEGKGLDSGRAPDTSNQPSNKSLDVSSDQE